MKHKRILIALTTTVLLGVGLAAQAEEKQAEAKKQTTCPVMGGKINKAQFVDVQGKRIYVCCPGCIAKVQAEPAKYIAQMEAEGIELDQPPVETETKAAKKSAGGCCGG